MKKISKTVVFFGNERLATGVDTSTPTLRALIDQGYSVAAVVSNYEVGQSRTGRPLEIAEVAQQNGIPLLMPNKPTEITKQLKAFRAEIGVLVAYGKIVPQSIIDIFPKGIVNIHPSLLPLHRGPTPLESVILDGSQKTGVSVMSLSKEMDAGPVYKQVDVPLTGNETKQKLADKLLETGKNMIIELLPGILDGSVTAKSQNNTGASYDRLISKADGLLDFKKPAVQLEHEVRAYAGWPKSRATIAGKDVVITEARVVKSELAPGRVAVIDKQLQIGTSQGALVIDKLKPAGKAEMTAAAFLAGHRL